MGLYSNTINIVRNIAIGYFITSIYLVINGISFGKNNGKIRYKHSLKVDLHNKIRFYC